MSIARTKHRSRGATFIVWIGVLAAGGFVVIASLLSAQMGHYTMTVEEARQRETLYAADAGLARAAAMMQRGESLPAEGLGFECGRAMVIATASPTKSGETAITSVASIQIGKRVWAETVSARAVQRDGRIELTGYEWERRYE